MSKEIVDKCNTIEDVLDIATNNGEITYVGNIGRNYSNFIQYYGHFKKYISENLPELTAEEILKYDEHRSKIKEVVYGFTNYGRLLDMLYFEQQKNKL